MSQPFTIWSIGLLSVLAIVLGSIIFYQSDFAFRLRAQVAPVASSIVQQSLQCSPPAGLTPGSYMLGVRATDSHGNIVNKTIIVNVIASTPSPGFSPSPSPFPSPSQEFTPSPPPLATTSPSPGFSPSPSPLPSPSPDFTPSPSPSPSPSFSPLPSITPVPTPSSTPAIIPITAAIVVSDDHPSVRAGETVTIPFNIIVRGPSTIYNLIIRALLSVYNITVEFNLFNPTFR